MNYKKMQIRLTALEIDNAQAVAVRLSRLSRTDAKQIPARDAALRRLDDLTREYDKLTAKQAISQQHAA